MAKIKMIPPTVEEHLDAFIRQFKEQDDRSAVILAAALVDFMLCELLKRALAPSPTAEDSLLGERGAVSNLHARSLLCARLGLIDEDMCRLVDTLRSIRNTYAHKLEYSGLSADPYAGRIAEAYKLISWYEPMKVVAERAFGDASSPTVQFRTLAVLASHRLQQAIQAQDVVARAEPHRLIPFKWDALRT